VERAPIDVERSISSQDFNVPKYFNMNDSEALSFNKEEPNIEIRDDEEEVELLVNHLRVFKIVFLQAWKIGCKWLYHVKYKGDMHIKL
jgi:hypothetical protein